MSSWHWKLREFLLAPVIERQEAEMAKDKDAIAELKQLLDTQNSAIDAVEKHISADEDTDYEAIKPLLAQAAANNTRLTGLMGVSNTGVDNSQPVDARTGEQVSVTGPVVEDSPQAAVPGSQDGASGDNAS